MKLFLYCGCKLHFISILGDLFYFRTVNSQSAVLMTDLYTEREDQWVTPQIRQAIQAVRGSQGSEVTAPCQGVEQIVLCRPRDTLETEIKLGRAKTSLCQHRRNCTSLNNTWKKSMSQMSFVAINKTSGWIKWMTAVNVSSRSEKRPMVDVIMSMFREGWHSQHAVLNGIYIYSRCELHSASRIYAP